MCGKLCDNASVHDIVVGHFVRLLFIFHASCGHEVSLLCFFTRVSLLLPNDTCVM